jgi:hypothetical protein
MGSHAETVDGKVCSTNQMKRYAVSAFFVLLLATYLAAVPDQGRGKDGKFHDPETGKVQPDYCTNLETNPHRCECAQAKPMCDGTDTKEYVGRQCQTWCRRWACKCETCCEEKKK